LPASLILLLVISRTLYLTPVRREKIWKRGREKGGKCARTGKNLKKKKKKMEKGKRIKYIAYRMGNNCKIGSG
jgi:hypothetical protein